MTPSFKEYYGKSIRIAPDGFSFYKQDGKHLESKAFPHSSSALISTEAPLFFAPGDQLNIVSAKHMPLLVPSEIYDPGKARDYLDLQFDTSHFGEAFSDTIGSYTAVYFLTKNELDTLSRLPYSYEVMAEASISYRMLLEHDSPSAILVNHNDDFIDVVATHKNEPMLANRFISTEPADVLYYLLNITRQLGLRNPDLLLHFFGEEDRKLLQLAKTYITKPIIL